MTAERNREILTELDRATACDCDQRELRYRVNKNGDRMYTLQCLVCGEYGTWLARSSLSECEKDAAIAVDIPLRQDWWLRRGQLERELKNEAADVLRERRLVQKQEHYSSHAWQHLRKLVLERDHYLCRGCLMAPATHVHHLTDEHFGDELAFELVALCYACHAKIHPHLEAKDHE